MINNHIGEKFGRLEILEYYKGTCSKGIRVRSKVKCKCDCGKIVIKSFENLQSGHTKSCGCLSSEVIIQRNKDNIKHNKSKTKLYKVYTSMKHRCYSSKHTHYKDYGGRGITICDEWLNDFLKFEEWAYKNGYCDGLTIDRIDVNSSYSPSNCRFISMCEQSQNRRSNILNKELVSKIRYYRDIEHKKICEICEILNLKEHYATVQSVYNNKTWTNV